MVTSTKGMNQEDYLNELGSRLRRAKEIAREAIKLYEKEGTEEAKQVAERAMQVARGLNVALTGPHKPVEQPSTVSSMLGEFMPTEPVEAPQRTGNIYADTPPMLDTIKEEILYPLNEKIGAAVSGFTDYASMGWADELFASMKEAIYGVDPEVSKAEYKAYQEGIQSENPVAAGLGGAAGVVAGAKMMPSFSGVQSPFVQGGLQGGTYMAATEAGKAEDGKVAAGVKGFAGGFLFGGLSQKVLNSGLAVADKLKNFKLKAALKKVEKEGSVASMKAAEKATYEAIPKNVNLFEKGDDVLAGIKSIKADADYLYVKGSPTNVEKVEGMITQAFAKNGGKMTPLQYKNLRTNLMSYVDDTPEGRVAGMIVSKFDDIAQQRMATTGNEVLLKARKISSQVRKAELFDNAFNQAKIEVGRLGQKADPYIVYRNTAERILNNPQSKFLSDTERKLVEGFITGNNAFQKAEGVLASLSPSSSNFWAMAHVGGAIATGNPLMLLTMAVTEGGRMNLNRTTIKEAEKLVKQLGGLEVVSKNMNSPAMIRILTVMGLDMDSVIEMIAPKVEKR